MIPPIFYTLLRYGIIALLAVKVATVLKRILPKIDLYVLMLRQKIYEQRNGSQ